MASVFNTFAVAEGTYCDIRIPTDFRWVSDFSFYVKTNTSNGNSDQMYVYVRPDSGATQSQVAYTVDNLNWTLHSSGTGINSDIVTNGGENGEIYLRLESYANSQGVVQVTDTDSVGTVGTVPILRTNSHATYSHSYWGIKLGAR